MSRAVGKLKKGRAGGELLNFMQLEPPVLSAELRIEEIPRGTYLCFSF